uniref:Reverse transcriptase domain-containing protein n=1 Tax=Tanacetum cinerariifolium TaxID=118510 RepID=A0A6L2MET3_TANCI|nr:reverse transcriptase domain-containing protein [Tanacetum cinerariifolium]
MISPAFVEANYEVLESLLREQRRHIRNEKEPWDLRKHRTGKEAGEEGTPKSMYASPNMPMYPNPTGSFTDFATPFVRWIDDYPLLDGLNMPSYIGSYDGKRDPDNFLHLFKGAIRMQKWLMPVACHMFTYTLKDSTRIWWNSKKTCSIFNYEDLKAKFQSNFSQQKKFTKTHLAVHNIKQREGEITRAFITRYTDDTLHILGLHKEQHIFGFVHGLRTRRLVEHLSMDLQTTYKGLMEKTYTGLKQEKRAGIGSPYTKDLTMDCSSACLKSKDRSLPQKRNQIEEAVKSGQLSHLVKGIKKEKNKFKGLTSKSKESTFPSGGSNSSAPVVIKAKVFGREVNWVHMDSESSCEVVYEHCFMKLKSSIKASKGYHQIQMAKGNKDKMAFFAEERVFCYQKMPFGLKNAGATYQRLVDNVFHDQIGRNLEAYVDDMVIKSTSKKEMLADIMENFEKFRSINMKLNPKKCSFGVEKGPFLRHLITKQGIRANPLKENAITDVEHPKSLKDVQSLNKKIAALSRFLLKGAERSLSFYKVLKSYTYKKNIQWTQEAEAALQEMKKFMKILPTLIAPVQGKILMMYLTTSTESISAALFTKREEEQVPIYFVIRVLQEAELNYPGMEKLILTLVHAARRLQRGDKTPKDFLIEVSVENNKKKAKQKVDTKSTKTELSCEWKLFTDGAASSNCSGTRLMLIEITSLPILVDSQLLVNQIKGTYAAKQPRIKEYLQKTKEALKSFDNYMIEHIRRNHNKKAGTLSKLALMTFEHLTKEVLVEVLPKRSIEEKEIVDPTLIDLTP